MIKFKHYLGSERNIPEVIGDFKYLHSLYAEERFYYDLKFKRINLLIIAYSKEKPIAFTAVNQCSGHWYFRGCYVHPHYRGRGLQNKLAMRAYDLLIKKGVKQVTTMAAIENVISQYNIEKRGMIKTGRRKTNYHYKHIF